MGALLVVACVYGVLAAGDALIIPFGVIHDDAAAIVQQALRRVGEIAPEVVAKGELVLGASGPSLVQVSDGATALVVGTRGHGPVVGTLLGSVSEYVVHHASCTTTVVR
jgi:nucleotide-binding universal stress UspA family protein